MCKFVQFYTNLDFDETEDTNACGSDTKLNNINSIINTDRCSTEDKLPLYKKDEASVWGGKSAASNQILKWQAILNQDQLIKCKTEKDTKSIKMFDMCRWESNKCTYTNNNIFDDRMYVGRIQFNLNDGKKRRFLYFQADYEPKYRARGAGE